MATADAGEYFTYEARLNTFKVTKKRGTKALHWPHKQIAPANLARAGFFFRPTPESNDNTVCFLCEKGLDGWEAGDDPLLEHLKHSPQCGWAIVAAIEAEIGDYMTEDPNAPEMVEAREATFAGRWPHDGKKGWKCKTKQLVEAGWKYTPTPDSDDMATCTYCQLALDGWEPNDKPFEEHFDRSPACPFFSLLEQYKGTGKSRSDTSRALRASSQSAASDTTCMTDQTTGPDDSVMTAASSVQQAGAKRSRAKRGATTRATKKKAKKQETLGATEENQSQQDEYETSQSLPPPQPRAKRGTKRGNETIDSSILTTTDGPLQKKRTGRTPTSTNDNSSIDDDDGDEQMANGPVPDTDTSKRTEPTKQDDAPPFCPANTSSKARPRDFSDDGEIERRLEVEMADKPDAAEIAQAPDSDRSQSRMSRPGGERGHEKGPASPDRSSSVAYAMFDPNLPEPNDKSIDDELKMLQAEMEVDENEPAYQPPKQGQRTSSRRTSKADEEMAQKAGSSDRDEGQQAENPEGEEVGDDHEMSVCSTDTVLKKKGYRGAAGGGVPKRQSEASMIAATSEEEAELPVKHGRGRPSKASLASQALSKGEDATLAEAPAKRGRGRPRKISLASAGRGSTANADSSRVEAPAKRGRGRPSKTSLEMKAEEDDKATVAASAKAKHAERPQEVEANDARSLKEQDESSPVPSAASAHPPTTGHSTSPAPSARQPVLSPSHSPQSSDAENQPPLSRPHPPATAGRVALAPIAATPVQLSPSKRNVLAGLKSSMPWTAANIDAIFGTPQPGRTRETSVDQFLKRGGELTSSERKMTVEEWIYFNANEAEKKLKHECETLVSLFENEGTRAINVLEGLEVIE